MVLALSLALALALALAPLPLRGGRGRLTNHRFVAPGTTLRQRKGLGAERGLGRGERAACFLVQSTAIESKHPNHRDIE